MRHSLRHRLSTVISTAAICVWASCTAPSLAADQHRDGESNINRSHAIAMHGEPKYGPDFKHFDYVNPDAPKGGRIVAGVQGTFNSFNPFIPKGTPASTGSIESLTTPGLDEPFTQYGLLAETIEWPDDRAWVAFEINPKARWHDGEPVTADDVVWTFNTLIEKGDPFYRFYYGSVSEVKKEGRLRVKFIFGDTTNLELPLIMGQLSVLPKHYWADKDFSASTMDPPLGSGPYRVKNFEQGRFVNLERVEDYWGKDLAVHVGQDNFDEQQVRYFRDTTAIRFSLLGGDLDYFAENQAKAWSVDYEVPAVEKGWLNKALFPTSTPEGMQGFAMNTRREIFTDPRVREALGYAFDFEWTNRILFYGLYTRSYSYFSNSELAATGLPKDEELEILSRYRGRVPSKVFTNEFKVPATDGSGWLRDNLKKAFKLLNAAGWVVKDMKLVNEKDGRPFSFEILLRSPAFERIVLPFADNLRRLGIDARVRVVETSQYVERMRNYDFDMMVYGIGQADSPGNEQREFWSSAAAERPASRNIMGIKDPVVDELVELLIEAPSRESLVARTRALDRVLLWGHYVIPNWHLPAQRMLYWDKFGIPDTPTKHGTSPALWWFDEAKAARLESAMQSDDSLTLSENELGSETRASGDASPLLRILYVLLGLIVVAWIVKKFRGAQNRKAQPSGATH